MPWSRTRTAWVVGRGELEAAVAVRDSDKPSWVTEHRVDGGRKIGVEVRIKASN